MPSKSDNKDREDSEVKFSAILDKLDALTKGKADSDGKLSQIIFTLRNCRPKL